MRSLLLFLFIPLFVIATVADEQSGNITPSIVDHPLAFKQDVKIDGKVTPELLPKDILMRLFLGEIIGLPEAKEGLKSRSRMFKKIGLEQSSIDALLYYAEVATTQDKKSNFMTVMCKYLANKGKAATQQGVAQVINEYRWNRRQVFVDIYDNLEYLIAVDDAKKLKNYLRTDYASSIYYQQSKDVLVENVDLKRDFKRCKLKLPNDKE